MNIFVLIGFGRSGIDFLQSLFDKHYQISQFPGEFFFDNFFNKVKNNISKEKIAKVFLEQHPHFFDSRLNNTERHDCLGVNKNEFFLINKKKFIKKFIIITKNICKKEIFVNLHLAYSYACGENLKKKKIIIFNAHQIEQLHYFDDIDYKIFYNIRHPLSSLTSSIKHWLIYEDGKYVGSWWLYYQIKRIFKSLKEAMSLSKEIYIIKLDVLHKNNELVMKKICKILKIRFNKCLKKSTYMGKKWWGDKLSVNYLNGINKNFIDKIDNNLFYANDKNYLKHYLKPILKKYDYKIKNNSNNFNKYLPLKIEILIWFKIIKLLKVNEILFIPYYWIKRIILFNKHEYKNVKLPKEIIHTKI